MKFLHPGEKIKHLRLNMKLKQDDIADNEISKSLISMIEKDKRNLTQHTAKIIAANLNKYYKSMGQEITPEFLLETEKDIAEKTIKEDIEKLQKAIKTNEVDEILIFNTFDKTMEVIKQWGFEDKLIELQMLRGDYYYYSYQYKEALLDYMNVFDYYMRVQDFANVAKMYNILGAIHQIQMNIDTAIVHFTKAVDVANYNDTPNKGEIKALSLFNQITSYRKIKRYDLVLSHIDIFKELKWQDPRADEFHKQILLIEANTHRDFNNYVNAMKIYDRLLQDKSKLDKETLFLVYENYAVLHRLKGDANRAIKLLDQATAIKDEVNANYLAGLYLDRAKCYNLLEDYDMVLALLDNGITLAEWVSKPDMVVELHFAFVEAYLKLGNYAKVDKHIKGAEKIIKEKDLKLKLTELYSYYIELYNQLGQQDKVSAYATKLRPRTYLVD